MLADSLALDQLSLVGFKLGAKVLTVLVFPLAIRHGNVGFVEIRVLPKLTNESRGLPLVIEPVLPPILSDDPLDLLRFDDLLQVFVGMLEEPTLNFVHLGVPVLVVHLFKAIDDAFKDPLSDVRVVSILLCLQPLTILHRQLVIINSVVEAHVVFEDGRRILHVPS